MKLPGRYDADVLFFFEGQPDRTGAEQLDGELLGWLYEAWDFSEAK